MRKLLFVMLMALALAHPAEAKLLKIDYKNSKLSFTGTQAGNAFTGSFAAYVAKVDFDPQNPKAADIDVTIDMTSAKTGDMQRDQALPQKEWFDTATYPQANFRVTSVKKIDPTHFEAKGQLTIKTMMHDVTLPFTIAPERDGTRFKGQLTIDRTQYNVGTGQWLSDEWVAHPVTISVDLVGY
ncbi:MAG TPA: YceI family protein [Alphaproteobacteria bacterium]|nr:YceI family protein [Alphaproteobacteria bacterium]